MTNGASSLSTPEQNSSSSSTKCSSSSTKCSTGRQNARAWFHYNQDNLSDNSPMYLEDEQIDYYGLGESFQRLVNLIHDELKSYDNSNHHRIGFFGFSQGAVFIHCFLKELQQRAITAERQRNNNENNNTRSNKHCLLDTKLIQNHLSFVILCGGFSSQHHYHYFNPSMHDVSSNCHRTRLHMSSDSSLSLCHKERNFADSAASRALCAASRANVDGERSDCKLKNIDFETTKIQSTKEKQDHEQGQDQDNNTIQTDGVDDDRPFQVVPSLHIFGQKDTTILPHRGRELATAMMKQFGERFVTVQKHSKGHLIPHDSKSIQCICQFVVQCTTSKTT